jgi:glutaryl-CoA dehydrogenase
MTHTSGAAAPPIDPLDFLALGDMLSDEERAIRDAVRDFVRREVLPEVGDWFERGEFPRHLVKGLASMGLLGMHLDGYGCAGTSAVAYGLACAELEAGDSGLRSFVSVQGSLAMASIWHWGSEEQKQQWLPKMAAGEAIGCFGLTEPDRGSDPGSMLTRARRDGSDWILSGTKMWITNGTIADVAVIWAQTDDGIRGFVVPTTTPGFTANEVKHKLSLRASRTGELVLDGCRLPADAELPGARGLRGPLTALGEARFGILFGVTGAARACYESALDYSLSREQFGRPIAGFQLTQNKLAEMVLRVSRSSLLALRIGRMKDAGTLRPEHVSVGKLHNTRDAMEVAQLSRSVHGANGISLEYPPIRHMANLESVVTYEGTAEIHALTIGRAITGINAMS